VYLRTGAPPLELQALIDAGAAKDQQNALVAFFRRLSFETYRKALSRPRKRRRRQRRQRQRSTSSKPSAGVFLSGPLDGSVLVWGASRFRGPDRRPDGVGQLDPPSYVLHISAGKLSDGTFVVKLRPAFDGVPYDAFENGIIHAVTPRR
jgi:hypothetical protein